MTRICHDSDLGHERLRAARVFGISSKQYALSAVSESAAHPSQPLIRVCPSQPLFRVCLRVSRFSECVSESAAYPSLRVSHPSRPTQGLRPPRRASLRPRSPAHVRLGSQEVELVAGRHAGACQAARARRRRDSPLICTLSLSAETLISLSLSAEITAGSTRASPTRRTLSASPLGP